MQTNLKFRTLSGHCEEWSVCIGPPINECPCAWNRA